MRSSLQRYQASLDLVSHDIVNAPEKLKDKVKWRDFSEGFITYMQRMKGQCDFSLAYILHNNDYDDYTDPEDFNTIEAFEEAIEPFSGPFYKWDNSTVFDLLKSYVLGCPHWAWIQGFEGRKMVEPHVKPSNITLMAPATTSG